MNEACAFFDNAAAYEAFMGRWSRAAGTVFLDWLAAPTGAHWLDVGCGTGAFTELIVDTAAPAAVSAVDPAALQIEHARSQPIGQRADFQIADAQALPYPGRSFELVVAALAINFMADRPRALAEMRRVGRPGGMVAGYVWNFAEERSPGSLLRTGLRAIGVEAADIPGAAESRLDALNALFERAGLEQVATRTIDVTMHFASFDELWREQTLNFGPRGRVMAALTEAERARLTETVRASLPTSPDGSVALCAQALAIKARVPS